MAGIRPVGQPAESSPYNRFAERAALWGSRDFLSARIDQWGQQFSFGKPVQGSAAPRGYAVLFHLEQGSDIRFSDFKEPKAYLQKASGNLERFRFAMGDALRGERPFFRGLTSQQYARQFLWEGNIHPITDTWNRVKLGDYSTVGSGLARVLGFGYLGLDTLLETGQAYRQAEEEGHNPWLKAGATFLGTAVKNLAIWEIAGMGFVFGSKLLPAIGCIPVGGILAGVGLACTVDYLARKLFKAVLPAASGEIHRVHPPSP